MLDPHDHVSVLHRRVDCDEVARVLVDELGSGLRCHRITLGDEPLDELAPTLGGVGDREVGAAPSIKGGLGDASVGQVEAEDVPLSAESHHGALTVGSGGIERLAGEDVRLLQALEGVIPQELYTRLDVVRREGERVERGAWRLLRLTQLLGRFDDPGHVLVLLLVVSR